MRFIRGFFAAWLTLALMAQLPIDVRPAHATVNSSVNKTIVLGNGAQTQFTFNFIGVAAAYISVILTDSSGNETVLARGAGATQYQIVLNAPVAGAIWGVGGTVTYNPSGTPIPSGSSLTIFRTLPLTQAITLQNQSSIQTLGKGAETGLDTSVMQAQQISENIARAIVVPLSDPTPPAPLPTIAQRANHGAAFDGQGNIVAGSTPASGVISSAMQPVVNAATLAAGRAAFGLGGIAVEGIGAGLQDDGAGNVRINSAFTQDSTTQTVTSAFHLTARIATGTFAYGLARSNTLWNGFSFTVYVAANTVSITPNAADNVLGLSSGVSLTLAAGHWYAIGTDGANSGIWYVRQMRAPVTGLPTSQLFLGAQAGTYFPRAGVRQIRAKYTGGGGASGGGGGIVTAAAGAASSFNGVVAAGGGGGTRANSSSGGAGGAGGTTATPSTATIRRYPGMAGSSGTDGAGGLSFVPGGQGGGTVLFGGANGMSHSNSAGVAPAANSGAGASAFGAQGVSGGAGGGGGGESVEVIIDNPSAFGIAFTIGAGGSSSGNVNSVSGADGQLLVEEIY